MSRNREILGVHYPSDMRAGKLLADQGLLLLLKCPTVTRLIGQATPEWQ